MTKITRAYGIDNALQNVFPQPVVAEREPAAGDKRYPIGQVWIDKSSNQAWTLTSVSAGAASWALSSPGASDVDTLTGDGGGAISPAAGNITLAGGTNITSAGAGSTITFNLDSSITIATQIESPVYTSAAGMQVVPAPGNDLFLDAAIGQDVAVTLGDNAGSNKISFTDSDDIEVAAIDSDGNVTVEGNIEINGDGSNLSVKGGSVTDFIGQTTLVLGTSTILNTNITANDKVFVQRVGVGVSTALGILDVTINAGVSIVINSLDPSTPASVLTADVSVVNYFIVREI